tara:strand:+ start:178 stop:582 length:405 start_codon:yes stop_codon:yes gene_type:complete
MKKVTMKNGEFLELFQGLNAVADLKGVKFGLLVSKNIKVLQEELADLEKAGNPSEEFVALSQKMQSLVNRKDDEGIAALEAENKELIDARHEQLAEVEALMEENTEIKLHMVKEDLLPKDITGAQIFNISKILE